MADAHPSENGIIHVALAFDEAYFVHGSTTIQSIVANKHPEEKLRIYVIDAGLSSRSRKDLADLQDNGVVNHVLEPTGRVS